MGVSDTEPISCGAYRGWVSAAYAEEAGRRLLASIGELAFAADATVISEGRNRNVCVTREGPKGPLPLMIKSFARPGVVAAARDAKRGSKALRSWRAATHLAEHGVGTPEPIAALERWDRGRLVESYYVSRFEDGLVSFTDALSAHLYDTPLCESLMALLQVVADSVRSMHAAGFLHNDLGNQNLLLRRAEDGRWMDVRIIDLNRGRIVDALSNAQRGRDLSRIYLPSDLLRVFIEMYCQDVPPAALLDAERRCRLRYAWHNRTRVLRRPFREARARRNKGERRLYPHPRDLWIWDARSAQAISTLRPRERHRYYPRGRNRRMVWDGLVALPKVWRAYRELQASAFKAPVAMRGRIGIGIEPSATHWQVQLGLLDKLSRPPVLVRFYHHEREAGIAGRIGAIRELHARGHEVAIALVQDRRAVLEPQAWDAFVAEVVKQAASMVTSVEIGHAINRVKWGIWNFGELQRLQAPLVALQQAYPDLAFTGPAGIDFEYPFVVSALKRLPEGLTLNALSHHLYVDRRGAPENYQGRFDTVGKCALARAIAGSSARCADRLVISEVNWPLAGTGVYSPVTSPYESPGPRFGDPSVSEDDYADYMLRYLLDALCSGMASRVYWWRLAAHGFGLVDDRAAASWRERPAFTMLARFLALLGDSTFVERQDDAAGNGTVTHRWVRFVRPDGECVAVHYAVGGEAPFADGSPGKTTYENAFGEALEGPPGVLTGRPLYARHLEP